jgi:hypothetical protein
VGRAAPLGGSLVWVDPFASEEVDFYAALTFLHERDGRNVLVLISGPERDDSPTILRIEGTLQEREPITEGRIESDDPALTPTFAVNGAQISMFASEVERVERLTEEEWLIVHQRHAVLEFRFRSGD